MHTTRPAGLPRCMLTIATVALAVALSGCDEGVETAAVPTAPAPANPAPDEKATTSSRSGSGSALGGARRAGQRTAEKVQDRQNELLREIDRQLEDN